MEILFFTTLAIVGIGYLVHQHILIPISTPRDLMEEFLGPGYQDRWQQSQIRANQIAAENKKKKKNLRHNLLTARERLAEEMAHNILIEKMDANEAEDIGHLWMLHSAAFEPLKRKAGALALASALARSRYMSRSLPSVAER